MHRDGADQATGEIAPAMGRAYENDPAHAGIGLKEIGAMDHCIRRQSGEELVRDVPLDLIPGMEVDSGSLHP